MPPTVESLRDPSMFIETPMLHILGRTDIVVIRERSEVLISYSKNCRVEEHFGGMIINLISSYFRDANSYPRPCYTDTEEVADVFCQLLT